MGKKIWKNQAKAQNQFLLYVLIFIPAAITAIATKFNTTGMIAVCIMLGIIALFYLHGLIEGKFDKVSMDPCGFITYRMGIFQKSYSWDDVKSCDFVEVSAAPRDYAYYALEMKDNKKIVIQKSTHDDGKVENFIDVRGINQKPLKKYSLDIINYMKRLWQAVMGIFFIGGAFFFGTIGQMMRRGYTVDYHHLFKTTLIAMSVTFVLFFLFAIQMRRLKLQISARGLSVRVPREHWEVSWEDVTEVFEYEREWGKKVRPFVCFKLKDREDLPFNEIHVDKTKKVMLQIRTYYPN